MRRILSTALTLASVCIASEAQARPKFSFGLKLTQKPAVAAPASTPVSAAPTVSPSSVRPILVPGLGARDQQRQGQDRAATSRVASPAALSTQAAAPPITPVAATQSAAKDSPDAFRAKCGAAQGSIVGATTHGFCVFN